MSCHVTAARNVAAGCQQGSGEAGERGSKCKTEKRVQRARARLRRRPSRWPPRREPPPPPLLCPHFNLVSVKSTCRCTRGSYLQGGGGEGEEEERGQSVSSEPAAKACAQQRAWTAERLLEQQSASSLDKLQLLGQLAWVLASHVEVTTTGSNRQRSITFSDAARMRMQERPAEVAAGGGGRRRQRLQPSPGARGAEQLHQHCRRLLAARHGVPQAL